MPVTYSQLPIPYSHSFTIVILLSIIFVISIMASFNLTPEELARFHAYIQQGGSLPPSAPNLTPNPLPSAFQPTQVPLSAPSSTQPFFSNLQPTPSQVPSQAQPSAIQPIQVASSASQASATQPFFLQPTQGQTPSQPPPVSQLYQNIRPHQISHPATTTTSRPGTTFNPFLGGAGLSLPTAHANQARLASALSSIP
jgi:hypothetical protein